MSRVRFPARARLRNDYGHVVHTQLPRRWHSSLVYRVIKLGTFYPFYNYSTPASNGVRCEAILASTLEIKWKVNVIFSIIKNAPDNVQFLHVIHTNICFYPNPNSSAILVCLSVWGVYERPGVCVSLKHCNSSAILATLKMFDWHWRWQWRSYCCGYKLSVVWADTRCHWNTQCWVSRKLLSSWLDSSSRVVKVDFVSVWRAADDVGERHEQRVVRHSDEIRWGRLKMRDLMLK